MRGLRLTRVRGVSLAAEALRFGEMGCQAAACDRPHEQLVLSGALRRRSQYQYLDMRKIRVPRHFPEETIWVGEID